MARRSAARPAGPVLGAYRCTRLLARGGGGEVWVAQREGGDEDDLVIKVALADDVLVRALRREWDNLFEIPSAALPLPVAWLDAAADGRPAIVMERRAGRPLGDALRGASPAAAVAVVEGALDALVALHAAGLVHGDLHPDNVLVDEVGRVSLLDLGLSQAPGDRPAHGAGLPAFAAPERLLGEGVDPRDDLFSLAASAWQGLVGEHPFRDYPAFMPKRHDRPAVGDGDHAQLLGVLAAWLSPARELRPASADVARREWRTLGDTATDGSAFAGVIRRPWRWGRWGEGALPDVVAGATLWITGPSGSGRSGALRAIEARTKGRVAWLRPAPGDREALALLEADVERLCGALPSLESGAEASTSYGLGERGGLASASMQRRVQRVRRALGPDAVLLVDDHALLNEALQTALAGERAMADAARLVIAAGDAPEGKVRFELPPVSAEQVNLAMNAATGRSHDLELCRAVSDAVGADRAAVATVFERLAAAAHVHEEHGRVSPAITGAELVSACRGLAAELAGETGAQLPDDPTIRQFLAHVAVGDVCHPGRGGDPAPAVDASVVSNLRFIRRLPGGAYAVSSGRHREALLAALDDSLIADAARERAGWLADRHPIEALELRVLVAARAGDKLPAARSVASACEKLTDSAQPARAARLAEGWLTTSSGKRGRRMVTVAAMHAAVASGRLQEVESLAAGLSNDDAADAQVQLALADRAFRAGDYPRASTCAQSAANTSNDAGVLTAACMIEAFAATWQGDLDAAAKAIGRGRHAKPSATIADQFSYLEALANYYRGDLAQARAVFAGLDASHAAAVRAAAAAGVGLCAHREGDLAQARQSYDRSRRLAEVAGDRSRVLNMTMNIAVLDHEAGDLGAALSGYERVIDDARRLGNPGALVRSLNNRGNLLTLIGDHDRAETDLEAALAGLQEVGNQYLEGNVLCLLAEIARKSSKPQVARDRIARAVAALSAAGAEAELLEIRIEEAEIALASGDVDAARDVASQTLDEAVRLANEEVRSRAAWLLARCELLALGSDLRDATADLREIADKLAACAADVPEGKQLLRVAVDTDRAVVMALLGDNAGAMELARDGLARLDRVAATLDPNDASVFRGGIVHAPRISLLRLIANLQAGGDTAAAATPTVNLGTALMGTVLALNRRLSGEHDLPRLLEVLMDAAVTLTGAERGFLVLDERATPKAVSDMTRAGEPDLRVAIARNLDQENLRKAAHKLSWSVAELVFADGERMVTTDASADPRLAEQASVHAGNLRSILCVPLALRGRTIGVLYVDNRFTSGAFTQDHASVLEALAAQAAIAIHTARLITRYSRSQKQLEASKAEVEELNEQLKQDLTVTEEALHSAQQALDAQRLEIERRSDYGQIKGESPPLRRLFSLMDRVRKHDFPVVVIGESGTGKELVARAIHFTGARRRGPFVAINCGAVPENLLESELFGHVRGAFTGAVAERDGLFVSADRGTLFLDEVGEMPLSMQVKLLRVLQSGEVQAVGGARLKKVDVRVLAATHRDLDQMVADGTFREDLLYRLRVVQLRVPPLRERVDDLPLLCEHFLTGNRESGLGEVERITPAAMAVMRSYAWPGNIRELETFLKSACLFANGTELDVTDVHSLVEKNRRAATTSGASEPVDTGLGGVFATGSMADIELAIIADRLERLGGNKSRTAESLGIDRGTLYTKLRKLNRDASR